MQSNITITLISVQFGVCCCCFAWFYFSHCFHSWCSVILFLCFDSLFPLGSFVSFLASSEKIKIKCKHYKFYIFILQLDEENSGNSSMDGEQCFRFVVFFAFSQRWLLIWKLVDIRFYFRLIFNAYLAYILSVFISFYPIENCRSGLQMFLVRFNRKRHFSNDTHAIRSK